jgi:hypothetical protein
VVKPLIVRIASLPKHREAIVEVHAKVDGRTYRAGKVFPEATLHDRPRLRAAVRACARRFWSQVP